VRGGREERPVGVGGGGARGLGGGAPGPEEHRIVVVVVVIVVVVDVVVGSGGGVGHGGECHVHTVLDRRAAGRQHRPLRDLHRDTPGHGVRVRHHDVSDEGRVATTDCGITGSVCTPP
jgi:hypothetical protein